VVTTFATRREGAVFEPKGACTGEVWPTVKTCRRPLRHDHVLSTEHVILLNFNRDKSDQQCEEEDDPGEQPALGPFGG
jgi:hypothetical protein